jgi:S-adenosylmethionine:tRNA ribosyltransferase-isomerase
MDIEKDIQRRSTFLRDHHKMKLREFHYDLPNNMIAQHARTDRGTSRLLVLNRKTGEITHTVFERLSDHVHHGDTIVINNTRVFKARIIAHKITGGKVDMLITHIISPTQIQAMISHAKRTMVDSLLYITPTIHARVIEKRGSLCTLECNEPIQNIIAEYGSVPLPHYIRREVTDRDEHDYQTIFADKDGSIAAPTAGLHFTEHIVNKIRKNGVLLAEITLHIGPGTFKPIRADDVEEHDMDAEYYEIHEQTIQMISDARRIIGVGTSVCRALETYAQSGKVNGMTELFIHPGHEFKKIDALITNFHMPCSTPLVLVSAFATRDLILNAYEAAKQEGYRFLSYGDAMLII